ncbi:MAG TPA: DUF599 domain-containing protein [Rhodobacteraceae bacterium]|nr:DUF599 domain-containing protein [Paracoccaceae bacterium]HBV55494.1 DUF599 domain-containing protein [Paracoccaceae bacterium]
MSGVSLPHFGLADFAALAALLTIWLAIGWRIENPTRERPSVTVLVTAYRREWMRQMVDRNPRIFDSQTLSTLRQGASFFASASMIAIGGGLALIGNSERLAGVGSDLQIDAPASVWEIKVLLILLFLTNAFLKFVWSHRLFGYCAVVMAAVPNDPTDAYALPRAQKAGEINITAAKSFNRGLRSVYFALAACGWLLGPYALIGATALTALVLWRREFASRSRAVLMGMDDGMGHTQT